MRKKASVSSRSAQRSSGSSGAAPLERGLLVAVELGGEWPSDAITLGATAARTRRVLAQAEGETPAAFAERLANSLDGLFGRGVQLETIILACNERTDGPAEEARRKALGLALGSMAKHKSGRAYLAASARSSGRLRHALSALAQGLFDEWRTAGLEVSLDFAEEKRSPQAGQPEFVFTARVA